MKETIIQKREMRDRNDNVNFEFCVFRNEKCLDIFESYEEAQKKYPYAKFEKADFISRIF